jgi:MFS family permease
MPRSSSNNPRLAEQRTGFRTVLAIIAITIGYVLNPLNGSLAVTAYPQLSEFFGVPYARMSAMVMYFMAATAVGQPLAGGLGDLLGRKNIFLVGILGFSFASAVAANAQSFDSLLLWRVTQAVFSGVIMANGMALVAQVAPRQKNRHLRRLLEFCLCGIHGVGLHRRRTPSASV